MKPAQPLLLIEPTTGQKQHRFARTAENGRREPDGADLKIRLKDIRVDTVRNLEMMAERFQTCIAGHSGVSAVYADDSVEAVDYIGNLADDTRTLFIGKSGTLNELTPGLRSRGYAIVDVYSSQFSRSDHVEKRLEYPWQLPTLNDLTSWDTFDGVREIWQPPSGDESMRDATVVLGVNTASAEDGALVFLQHSDNISRMLSEAKRVVVVVGLEKIVRSRSDALFQAKYAGAAGMPSVLLDLKADGGLEVGASQFDQVSRKAGLTRDLHVVILNNRRREIAGTDFGEILWCIGCRACALDCPGYRNLTDFRHFPKEHLWSFLVGLNPSIELCSHCTMCESVCPVDIKLAKLISKAKAQYCPQIRRSLDNVVLMNMTGFAPHASSMAPLVNWSLGLKPVRLLMDRIVGIDRRRAMPPFRRETLDKWTKSRSRNPL